MEIFWFVVIGAVAGWLAGKVLKGVSFGLIGNSEGVRLASLEFF